MRCAIKHRWPFRVRSVPRLQVVPFAGQSWRPPPSRGTAAAPATRAATQAERPARGVVEQPVAELALVLAVLVRELLLGDLSAVAVVDAQERSRQSEPLFAAIPAPAPGTPAAAALSRT